jgi:hypothetical protein
VFLPSNTSNPNDFFSFFKGSSWLAAQLWLTKPFPLAPVLIMVLLFSSRIIGKTIKWNLWSVSF